MSFLKSWRNTPSRTRSTAITGIAFLSLVTVALAVYPTYPTWWTQRNAINTTQGVVKDDYAGANLGQLKNFARAAYEELQAKIPASMGGAGATLRNQMQKWVEVEADGSLKRVSGHLVPATQDPSLPQRDDYAAANLGQMKAVSKLFYDRLKQLEPNNSAWNYPWTGTNANDRAAGNLGQLKKLFYFDLGTMDADSDGVLDMVENGYGTGSGNDSDGDGQSDADEINDYRDPNKKDNPVVNLWVSGLVVP